MPDHTAEIARIDALLNTGLKTVVIDGITQAIDVPSLRKRRRELLRSNTATRKRRPFLVNLNLE